MNASQCLQVLELPQSGATQKEVRSAYRRLALIWHPDKNPSPEANERFRKIDEASKHLKSLGGDIPDQSFRTAGTGASASSSGGFTESWFESAFDMFRKAQEQQQQYQQQQHRAREQERNDFERRQAEKEKAFKNLCQQRREKQAKYDPLSHAKSLLQDFEADLKEAQGLPGLGPSEARLNAKSCLWVGIEALMRRITSIKHSFTLLELSSGILSTFSNIVGSGRFGHRIAKAVADGLCTVLKCCENPIMSQKEAIKNVVEKLHASALTWLKRGDGFGNVFVAAYKLSCKCYFALCSQKELTRKAQELLVSSDLSKAPNAKADLEERLALMAQVSASSPLLAFCLCNQTLSWTCIRKDYQSRSNAIKTLLDLYKTHGPSSSCDNLSDFVQIQEGLSNAKSIVLRSCDEGVLNHKTLASILTRERCTWELLLKVSIV